jgi:hypothetical protein
MIIESLRAAMQRTKHVGFGQVSTLAAGDHTNKMQIVRGTDCRDARSYPEETLDRSL